MAKVRGEALSVAMRVKNLDCAPVIAEGRDPAHAESGLNDLVDDDIPIFHARLDCTRFVLRIATTR